jgi:hypothetical protein
VALADEEGTLGHCAVSASALHQHYIRFDQHYISNTETNSGILGAPHWTKSAQVPYRTKKAQLVVLLLIMRKAQLVVLLLIVRKAQLVVLLLIMRAKREFTDYAGQARKHERRGVMLLVIFN